MYKFSMNKHLFVLVWVILLLPLINAVEDNTTTVLETHGYSQSSTIGTQNVPAGINYTVGPDPILITNITAATGWAGSTLYIYNGSIVASRVVLAQCTASSNKCAVNYRLEPGARIFIGGDKGGATYQDKYAGSISPVATRFGSFRTGVYGSGSTWANDAADYYSIASFEVYNLSYVGVLGDSIVLNTNLALRNISYSPLQLTYNATFVGATGSSLYTCTLNNTGTINQTSSNVNLSIQNTFNITLSNREETVTYGIRCNSSLATSVTAQFTYDIDTINPQITLTNHTVFYREYDNVSMIARYSDTNLYAVNFTIRKETDNVLMYTKFNQTAFASNNISFNYNYWTNTTWNNSRYVVVLDAWDSHTAKEIPVYNFQDIPDGILIESSIKITSPDINKIKRNKKTDRYTFDIKFKKSNPIITVECEDINYVDNSGFDGHFVCLKAGKWLDWETGDMSISNYIVTRISPSKYDITLLQTNSVQRDFVFTSIGDLNAVNQKYYFNISNKGIVYNISPYTGTYSNLTQPSFTFNTSYITSITLYIDGVASGTTTNVSEKTFGHVTSNVSLTRGREYSWYLYHVGNVSTDFNQTDARKIFISGDYPALAGFFVSNACYVTMGNGGYYVQP